MLKLVLYDQLKPQLKPELELVIQDELEHLCWVIQQAAVCNLGNARKTSQ